MVNFSATRKMILGWQMQGDEKENRKSSTEYLIPFNLLTEVTFHLCPELNA